MDRTPILYIALATSLGSITCVAQDRVLVEKYRDFGFFQKIDLAASYFTDPTEAQRASVAYYVTLKNTEPSESVILLVEEGKANYSVIEGKNIYKIIDPSYKPTTAELRSGDVGLITEDKKILEKFQPSPVISWGEIEPIDMTARSIERDR